MPYEGVRVNSPFDKELVLVVGKLYFARLKSFLPGGGRKGPSPSLDDVSGGRPGDSGPTA